MALPQFYFQLFCVLMGQETSLGAIPNVLVKPSQLRTQGSWGVDPVGPLQTLYFSLDFIFSDPIRPHTGRGCNDEAVRLHTPCNPIVFKMSRYFPSASIQSVVMSAGSFG